jgi:hypothetical protein
MRENKEYAAPRHVPRIAVETVIAIAGILLLAGAIAADQSWWDRHFLPVFFWPHEKFVLSERLVRLAGAVAGTALVFFFRPVAGRLVQRMPAREIALGMARIILPIGLALVVSEVVLDHKFTFAANERQVHEEPLRQPDPKLGWTFAPSRQGQMVVGGRNIAYAMDSRGYRVRAGDTQVHTDLPAILFTGESIIAGYGLNWDESIPAQAGALLKTQTVNMAVFGYANDQAYLRLAAELPRFRKPVAVVSLFIPSLFVRNLGDDRPHLGPGLVWEPGIHRWWLTTILRFLVPYHGDAEIERGIQATRAVLVATAALARKHGAVPLVVDAQYGAEAPVERMLRQRILEGPGIRIDYVLVQLDPSWHLKGDLHPDPRAAHAIATAVAARLGPTLRYEAAYGIPKSMTQ